MLISEIIAAYQKILDEHGDVELAVRQHDDWRRHKKAIVPPHLQVESVVDSAYGYIPVKNFQGKSAFNDEYTAKLMLREQRDILVIG